MMKDTEQKDINAKAPIRDWRHRVPLTVKMVVLTIVACLVVWLVLDYAQTEKLRNIFQSQLTERLGRYAMEDRLSFDRYVKTFQGAVNLFISQKDFIDYVENQEWTADDTYEIQYHRRSPSWIPGRSILRTFTQTRYALLLDALGRTREVYRSRQHALPPSLLSPTALLITKSHDQNFMTSMSGIPYIISSKSLINSRGKLQATLMLASPIDDEFLTDSLGTARKGHLVALLTSGVGPRILTSSNLEELPVGTPINSLQDRYLITGKEFFDYGASEVQIKFISFVSLDEVDLLSASVISRARQERAVLALVLILTSALMMYWTTRHIQQITKRITFFSKHTLGMKPQELPKGDQLQVLNERFQSLTEEVVRARETIKKQAEEQTRLIVNNAFDAIITMNENGEIMTWNPQSEFIFGWKHDEVVGQKVSDIIIPPQYKKAHEKRLSHFNETGEGAIFNMQVQISAIHRERHEFPVELTIAPARSGDKYIFIAIIRDITERKKAEEKLQNLNAELAWKNRELEQIVYITSHDLRSPLVNIYGFSRELGFSVNKLVSDLGSSRIPADIKESTSRLVENDIIGALEYITKSVSKMNALLDGLLRLSRLGRIELKIQPVDMNNLMSDVAGIFEYQLKDAGVDLVVSDLPPCKGDQDQLNQVFSNLIGNAMKFLNDQQPGIIKVTGYRQNGKSVYCVEDNGIGINHADQDKIFEMFRQLSPGKNSGEGLGLTIVQKAVEMHGGKIWVESEPGKGSSFFVSLPS